MQTDEVLHNLRYFYQKYHVLCTYQCHAPPTTPREYVGIGWGFDNFGSRFPRTSGRTTSQILVEFCEIQATGVAY